MTRKGIAVLGLAAAVCVLSAGIAVADPAKEGASTLVLGETRYDFGTVVEGSKVSYEFVIANQGDAPLQILDRIKTNDPVHSWFSVGVTGKVEKFVDIQPERVHLETRAASPGNRGGAFYAAERQGKHPGQAYSAVQ